MKISNLQKNDLIISNKSSKEFDIIHYGNDNYYDLDLFKTCCKNIILN